MVRGLVWLRKGKGWSQEKLALESGLARSYVGDVERGGHASRRANNLFVD
jgi:transcriptional regulator with XRE-family HTH domain